MVTFPMLWQNPFLCILSESVYLSIREKYTQQTYNFPGKIRNVTIQKVCMWTNISMTVYFI
jgi:hypothetical protein